MTYAGYTPGKQEFLARLHREDRHKAYMALRESLRSNGIPPSEAWRVAGVSFTPIEGGGPPEYPPTEEVLLWLKKLKIENPWPMDGVKEPVLGPIPKTPAPLPGYPEPPPFESETKRIFRRADSMAALTKLVDPTKRASKLECADWAADNISTEWNEIDADSVPSRQAIEVLSFAKESRRDFFLQVWVKLLPTAKGLEQEARYSDDGTETLVDVKAFIDDIIKREQEAQEAQDA